MKAFPLLVVTALSLGSCTPEPAEDDNTPEAAQDDSGFRGLAITEPRFPPEFTLTDTDGEPFAFRERTAGFLTMVFFGYTYCPDICPIHMANLGAVLKEMRPSLANRIRVVFVTTDPRRDTPERLRSWLDNFHSGFIGLTGDVDYVNQIQRGMGLPPAQPGAPDSTGYYQVGHSAFVVAITPDGYGRMAYPFGVRQADWAHDLPRLLEAEWDVP